MAFETPIDYNPVGVSVFGVDAIYFKVSGDEHESDPNPTAAEGRCTVLFLISCIHEPSPRITALYFGQLRAGSTVTHPVAWPIR